MSTLWPIGQLVVTGGMWVVVVITINRAATLEEPISLINVCGILELILKPTILTTIPTAL